MAPRSLDPRVVEELVNRFSRTLREALAGVALPPPVRETAAGFPDVVAEMRRASSQPDVLRALLRGIAECGARAALFVARGEHLAGWEGVGFEDESTLGGVFAGVKLPREQAAVAALFAEERPIHAEMGGAYTVPDFGQTVRGEALLVPVMIHGKIAGVLYADPASGDASFDPRGVRTLAEIAGLAVERLVLAKAVGRIETPAPAPSPTPAPAKAPAAVQSAPEPPAAAPRPKAASPAVDRVQSPPEVEAPAIEWSKLMENPAVGAAAEADDAGRYCRLLMEEILLYHADKVEEGRIHKDLVSRLSDELAKARQLYERRVEARVRESGDYFEEALLKVLAGGDASVLGAPQEQMK